MDLVCGVGVRSPGRHATSINGKPTKCYRVWSSMLDRCYSPLSLRLYPTYRDVTVKGDFIEYQLFGDWFEANYVDGWRMDKDILKPGNKVYAPDFCCFVPHIINTQLNHCRISRGEFPTGVSWDRRANKFSAKISTAGATVNLGLFASADLARSAYLEAKKRQMIDLAEQYKALLRPDVYSAILKFPVEVDFHGAP